MPDFTLSDAIKEAWAAAPSNEIFLDTFELRHTSFTSPIRIVLDNVPLDAFLEAGAPENPGEEVTFVAVQLDYAKPEMDDGGQPEMTLSICNVDPSIEEAMDGALFSGAVIEMTYRVYLASDLSGPQNNPPLHMEVKSGRADDYTVTIRCGFGNLNNTRFPAEIRRLVNHPSLAEVY